ncbi:probable G-protein coupled receptor 141 [Megalops cyprinoides]|uniref:probable G-protein coupled receptor 141 n=1 Tax=Megalops cyprinoides TaxID=118141 RepID=UPI001863BE52|nr:probable G-protein coupled receptor 141 [Megalops cyprinoides]
MGAQNNTINNDSSQEHLENGYYRYTLLIIYSVVLLGGTVGITLMINILKSNMRSVTTVAILNVIVVHLFFLLTVPFRIYYYASGQWNMSQNFCKMVSGMIHAHMYIAFTFYVIILVIRYFAFYSSRDRVEFYRKLHALVASITVWVAVLIIVPSVLIYGYGLSQAKNGTECFNFGVELGHAGVAALNYGISSIIIVVSIACTCCQAHILWRILKRYGPTTYAQQDFWAQMKSLCFVLVMLVCFVPYHVFRVHYVRNREALGQQNEVFLALTALCCFDVFTFMGRGTYGNCNIICCDVGNTT